MIWQCYTIVGYKKKICTLILPLDSALETINTLIRLNRLFFIIFFSFTSGLFSKVYRNLFGNDQIIVVNPEFCIMSIVITQSIGTDRPLQTV